MAILITRKKPKKRWAKIELIFPLQATPFSTQIKGLKYDSILFLPEPLESTQNAKQNNNRLLL